MFHTLFRNQLRQPKGIVGLLISQFVSLTNKHYYNYAYRKINPVGLETILEIGFGTGQLIHRICEKSDPDLIIGIDHSKLMYKQACSINKKSINQNRVKLYSGNLDDFMNQLPWFDIIYMCNTHQYLAKPSQFYKLINALMEPTGEFVIMYQEKKSMSNPTINNKVSKTVHQLKKAGFIYVNTEIEKLKNKIVVSLIAAMEKD